MYDQSFVYDLSCMFGPVFVYDPSCVYNPYCVYDPIFVYDPSCIYNSCYVNNPSYVYDLSCVYDPFITVWLLVCRTQGTNEPSEEWSIVKII